MAVPRGIKIEVSRSIRVGDNHLREAPTLGNAYREDSPATNELVDATIYRNVLPTDRGYRSAFDLAPVTKAYYGSTFRYTEGLNQAEAAKAAPKQHVLWLETGSLHRVGLMLGEDGIWLIAPSLDYDEAVLAGLKASDYVDAWYLIHPMAFEQGTRYLWTVATIDGVVYAYRQGESTVIVITDYATSIRDRPNTLVWENEYLQLRIREAEPSFINMTGQMGLFKADNRLGFWDSDNAISWSSALNKLEFTPDVTTFAGVTKYSDVTGVITKVVEHGRGFIIYASRSVVHCQAMPNSPEKWAGSAVIGNSGVQFDTQIAVGHPSTIHYVWIDNSMGIIDNGQLSFSLPELADTVRWNDYLVRLEAPCSRYLYVSLGKEWVGGKYDRRAHVLFDGLGRPFYKVPGYYRPGYEVYLPNSNFWGDLIDGGFIDWEEDEWTTPEIGTPELPPLEAQKPIIPCYSGNTYKTPPNAVRLLEWHKISPEPATHPMTTLVSAKWETVSASRLDPVNVYIDPSKPNLGVVERETEVSEFIFGGEFRPFMERSQWDMTQPDQIGVRYIDKAGEEFAQEVYDAFSLLVEDMAYIQTMFDDSEARKECLTVFYDEDALQTTSSGYIKNKGWLVEDSASPTESCTIVEPIDLAQRYSKTPTVDVEAINSEDPVALGNLAGRWRELARRIRVAIDKEDVADLRVIAQDNPNLREEILKAIRSETLPTLESMARDLERRADVVDKNVENGTPELLPELLPVEYDLNWAILEAIYADTLGALGGIEILNHGLATGYLPVDGEIRSIWDGCKMVMQTKIDRKVAYTVRYLFGESVFTDDPLCREYGTDPDPDNPTYSFWYRYEVFAFPGTLTMNQGYLWVPESLIGKTAEEREFLLNDSESPLWVTIFDAELSGWGFEWQAGGSSNFRKTHNVSPFKPCELLVTNRAWGTPPESPEVPREPIQFPQDTTAPPPTTLPNPWATERIPGMQVPDQQFFYPDVDKIEANFQKGTKAPYYPTYEWALVYDSLLKKWGSLNVAHQMVYSNYPVNSNTQVQTGGLSSDELQHAEAMLSAGIIPVFHTPTPDYWDDPDSWYQLRDAYYQNWDAGLLTAHLLPCGLGALGGNGLISYTKIGLQRAGHTLFTGLSVKLDGIGMGQRRVGVEIGASLSNVGFNGGDPDQGNQGYGDYPLITQLNRYSSQYGYTFEDLEAPCRVVGRWATVTLKGSFDLTGLTIYGKPVGRVRYFNKTEMY